MSNPARPRSGSGALVAALLIVAVIVVSIAVAAAAGVTPQGAWDSFFPVSGSTPATDRGMATRQLYNVVFAIAAVIFIGVEALIVFTVFRYRRREDDTTLPPQTHGNNLVEAVWTVIPAAIVLGLFVMTWQTLGVVDAKTPSQVNVRAVAARFQWRFDYLDRPDGPDAKVIFSQALPVGQDGGLVLPVGEPVHISLTSPDVIHAFYVPKFLFKRDVVPGKLNQFDFTIDEAGTYRGQCAELCGPYHGSMLFEVHALPKADFDTWLAAAVAKASATPTPAPSGAASPGASAPAGGTGGSAGANGSGGSGAPAGGATVQLAAKNIAFDQAALTAPAGAPFTLHFTNGDDGVPHNVEIKDASGSAVFKGDIITGPAQADYAVPALAAGTYTFACTVHPNMTGTLTVQ